MTGALVFLSGVLMGIAGTLAGLVVGLAWWDWREIGERRL